MERCIKAITYQLRFCRNIEISTYIGDGGCIGYEVSASNDDGIEYYEVDCEGLLFIYTRYRNL